jgi:soluble lytic murein transglycosylase-like protein
LFFATTLLAWNAAPDLRERTINKIDTHVTSGVEWLLGDTWRPEPTSYAEFAAQTLNVPQDVPGFPLDVRSAVRKVFLDKGTLDSARALLVADTLVDEAQKMGVDPLLLVAVIEVESKFDPRATSLRGARGLMQLMPDTRAWLIDRTPELWNETNKDDQLSPESNVRVGVHYFAHLARGFRRLEHVLQAYNCGPGRLVAILNGESVLPEESKYYADKVLRIHARLRREFHFAKL